GLSLTFTAGNKLTIVGSLATTVAAGKETITASQSGDANYNAAAPVSISFCITPPKPVITVVTPSPSTFQLTSSAQSGNQWYRDGTAINGATEKTISAIESGIYTVVATTDGCSSIPSEEKVILITGLESRNAEIRAYPNPVEDELVFELTGSLRSIPSTVKLYDMNGKQVESANGTGKIQLNTAFYAPGNYLVVIESGNQITSGRILKN
ncbi:MAG: T9SS type A sorting domain-containing protein, partial [Bacteroidota bacterium]